MTDNPDDVVKVAAGEMVVMELYKQGLADAGIQAKVLGEALESSFGTAIPKSIELWVHRSDEARAREVIERMEAERGHHGSGAESGRSERREPGRFPHPVSDPKPPRRGGSGPHGHYQKEP
jgi:hypothetical protein